MRARLYALCAWHPAPLFWLVRMVAQLFPAQVESNADRARRCLGELRRTGTIDAADFAFLKQMDGENV